MNRIDYRRLGELPGDFACWLTNRLGFTVIRIKELEDREREAFDLGREFRAHTLGRPLPKPAKVRRLHAVSGATS